MASGKVLIVTPWYGKKWSGGVAIAVENLVASLKAIGISSLVIIPDGIRRWPKVEQGEQGETIIALPLLPWAGQFRSVKSFLGYWLRIIVAWFGLFYFILGRSYRVAHFHYCLETYAELANLVRSLGLPIAITFHGSDVLNGFNAPEVCPAMKKLIRVAGRVVTVSHGLRRELLLHQPQCEEKCRTVWNPVPLAFWNQAKDFPERINPEFDFLYVGSLLKVKGPDLLIEAFSKVARLKPESRLLIIGSGEIEEDLKNQVKSLNLETQVEFAGKVAYEKIIKYYRRTRIVVVPSRFEGFGFVPAEAALLEKPAIAASVGGLPEVVEDGETGVLFPVGNAEKLAEIMLRLLDNPDLVQRLGTQARIRALRLFDPALCAQAYLNLYREISRKPIVPESKVSRI